MRQTPHLQPLVASVDAHRRALRSVGSSLALAEVAARRQRQTERLLAELFTERPDPGVVSPISSAVVPVAATVDERWAADIVAALTVLLAFYALGCVFVLGTRRPNDAAFVATWVAIGDGLIRITNGVRARLP